MKTTPSMRRSIKLKYYWLLISLSMATLIAYKVYLLIYDADYEALNATQIEKIQARLEDKGNYKFAVIGNIKNSMRNLEKRIIPLMQENQIKFMISAGNAVYDGAEGKYRLLHRGLSKAGIPYLLSPGENEVEDFGAARYYRHFGPFFYSFELNDSYFILLDGSGNTAWGSQYRWLQRELKQAESYRHRFIVLAQSIAPLSSFPREDSPRAGPVDLDQRLQRLFSQHKVTTVFSSSYPGYQDSLISGVHYIMTGSGGGLLLGKENQYQFVQVNVNADGVRYTNISVPNENGFLRQEFETLKLYLYSLFYMSYFNTFMIIGLLGLLVIKLHNFINKRKHLYRDFSIDESAISESPLRIAFFSNNYLPFVGGVPISIKRLYDGLSHSGMIIKIFAPAYRQAKTSADKANVFRCPVLFNASINYFPVVNIFSSQIKLQFDQFNSDIVHVHHPFWMGKKGLRLARKNGIPVVLTYHTRLEYYTHYIPFRSNTLKNLLAHSVIKHFANKCDAIITPTNSTEEYLRNLGVSALIETIPTGVDIDAYDQFSALDIQDYREQYVKADEHLLISVSRLAKEKNLDFLITGLKKLKDNSAIRFKCLLVGDGPQAQHLKERARSLNLDDTIIFAGNLEPDNVIQAYLAADLFVFASTSETQGMVLLEAMAAGCPVVAVNSSGVYDVVRNNYNGFNVEESTDPWSDKIATILQDKQLFIRLSKNSRKFAARYAIDTIADRVLRLYRRIIVLGKSRSQ